jgi:hypothetical protein
MAENMFKRAIWLLCLFMDSLVTRVESQTTGATEETDAKWPMLCPGRW